MVGSDACFLFEILCVYGGWPERREGSGGGSKGVDTAVPCLKVMMMRMKKKDKLNSFVDLLFIIITVVF